MATVEELAQRYSKDAAFRAKVDGDIRALREKGTPDMNALMALAKKYGLKISLAEAPKYLALAKRHGLI